MKIALWSPPGGKGRHDTLVDALAEKATVTRVHGDPSPRPEVEVDVYHLFDDPACGFVYRALLDRPGVVILDSWNLHRLVHAVTAGRGDDDAYLGEARHAHGEKGAFVARQVLNGRGGVLPTLVPLNERVMEGAVAVVTPSAAVREQAVVRLPDRPVLLLSSSEKAPDPDQADAARAVLELLRAVAPGLPEARAAFAARRAREGGPAALGFEGLAVAAREVGVMELPTDVAALVEGLFDEGAP